MEIACSSLSASSGSGVPSIHTPVKLIRSSRKSVVFKNCSDLFDDVAKGYLSFDGKFKSCNEMFADIIGVSADKINEYNVISLVKFDSFEGPQTASYTFDNLNTKFMAQLLLKGKADPPEFEWIAPLGMIRKGVLETRLEVCVRSERYQIGEDYVLSVYLNASKSSKNRSGSVALKHGKSFSASYGNMTEFAIKEALWNKKLNILVSDNSSVALKLIERQFRDQGHHIDVKQKKCDALACMKSSVYDVVLMEIQLEANGAINGLEVAHEWRLFEKLHSKVSSSLTIIAMSAEYDDSLFMEAMNAGYDGFIVKPFTTPDLLGMVHMIMDEKLAK